VKKSSGEYLFERYINNSCRIMKCTVPVASTAFHPYYNDDAVPVKVLSHFKETP